MEKKYMLIEVAERDISEPELFDTLEEAQEKMLSSFCKAMGYEAEDADDLREQLNEDGYDEDNDTMFGDTAAYCERYGNNFDWKIFKKEEDRWQFA